MSATATPAPAHVTNSFDFEIAAPFARLAPLFGPEAERAWAGEHWDPVFLYPQPVKLATTIDVSLHAIDPTHTAVHVTYTRTALDPTVNDDVRARGEDDRNSGPEWKRGLEACLHLEHKN
jgi:hypothetical protein